MHVTQLWRYPVKSMVGEPLASVDVGPLGLAGDRQWGLVDRRTGLDPDRTVLMQVHAERSGNFGVGGLVATTGRISVGDAVKPA